MTVADEKQLARYEREAKAKRRFYAAHARFNGAMELCDLWNASVEREEMIEALCEMNITSGDHAEARALCSQCGIRLREARDP